MISIHLPSPLELIKTPNEYGNCYFKRDDLIHPILAGNKWRKLLGFIKSYYHSDKEKIVSAGSLYSNYILSLSFLCYKLNIPLLIHFYGHEVGQKNPYLNKMEEWGISYDILPRSVSKDLVHSNSKEYFIPEGANAPESDIGLKQLVSEMPEGWDQEENVILVCSGTGKTLSGFLKYTKKIRIFSYSPVKSFAGSIHNPRLNWINDFGSFGFASYNKLILQFINNFYEQNSILLDPIYLGPALYLFYKSSLSTSNFKNIYIYHCGGQISWLPYIERHTQLIKDFPSLLEIINQSNILNFNG